MSVMNIDERLTTSQAARRAGVTPETIRNWIHDKRLTASRTATNQYRIAIEDLEQVLNSETTNEQHQD